MKLGDVSDVLTGFPFKSEEYTDDPTAPRLLRGDNVAQGSMRWDGAKRWPVDGTGEVDRFWLRDGDVILAMDRPWIEAGLKYASLRDSDLPALLVQRVARLRGSGQLDTKFLKYVIGSRALLAVQTGTAIPHISTAQIRSFQFSLPSLREQRVIAHVLGTLDDKIELNRRMNETLEAMARAIFKSWFVDFDLVRAKAESRDRGLPRQIAYPFPKRFDDSRLGKIPAGWSVGPILNHAKLLSGGTPKTDLDRYWNGGIPWASAKDVSQCREPFLIRTERSITEAGLDESATQMIRAFSTVIVARGATTGRMVLSGSEMAMNQTCYALVSLTSTPFALYCQLLNEIGALVHAAHGSVFDTITTNTFANSVVILPPVPLLQSFERFVSPLFNRILANLHESRTLAALPIPCCPSSSPASCA